MSANLPPVGSTVTFRFGATGTVEKRTPTAMFVRWPEGGGMWITAAEQAALIERITTETP